MILFALGVMKFGSLQNGEAGWIRGLQIAVVAVIANAVGSMAKSLCQGKVLALIALISAAIVIGIKSPLDPDRCDPARCAGRIPLPLEKKSD